MANKIKIKGISILEVLVGVTLLAITIAPLLLAVTKYKEINERIAIQNEAKGIANWYCERFSKMSKANLIETAEAGTTEKCSGKDFVYSRGINSNIDRKYSITYAIDYDFRPTGYTLAEKDSLLKVKITVDGELGSKTVSGVSVYSTFIESN